MFFLALGLILVIAKFLGWGPVATVDWWWLAVPFGLAVLWWWWSDSSGYTSRMAMERQDEKRRLRREQQRDALGLNTRNKKKS